MVRPGHAYSVTCTVSFIDPCPAPQKLAHCATNVPTSVGVNCDLVALAFFGDDNLVKCIELQPVLHVFAGQHQDDGFSFLERDLARGELETLGHDFDAAWLIPGHATSAGHIAMVAISATIKMGKVNLSFISFSLLGFIRSGSQIFQNVAFVLRAEQSSFPHVTEHRSSDSG